mmetsp:Transcript_29537/g.55708  ORF Transcript_29537/g.55708 Transcript_29537/m.55708 type:complete len:183 (+) Transcript_29537:2220-2768(+)
MSFGIWCTPTFAATCDCDCESVKHMLIVRVKEDKKIYLADWLVQDHGNNPVAGCLNNNITFEPPIAFQIAQSGPSLDTKQHAVSSHKTGSKHDTTAIIPSSFISGSAISIRSHSQFNTSSAAGRRTSEGDIIRAIALVSSPLYPSLMSDRSGPLDCRSCRHSPCIQSGLKACVKFEHQGSWP